MKYEEMLAGVDRLLEMGGLQEALDLLQKMRRVFPEQQNELELCILQIMFQRGRYAEALEEALQYLPYDDGQIYQWIMSSYYEPFQEDAKALQQDNLRCLEQYEYYYGVTDNNAIKTLLYDGCDTLIYCSQDKIVRHTGVSDIELQNDEITLIANAMNIDCLAEQISKPRYTGVLPKYQVPVYLYYDEDVFAAIIQCVNIKQLLKDKCVVLMVGEENLHRFFGEPQVIFPCKIIATDAMRLKNILDYETEEKIKKLQCEKEQIEAYYCGAKEAIDERIRQKKPRVLFYTSYYTTALQYHTRDLRSSAEKQGLNTALLIERGAFFSISETDFYTEMNAFRPDIIFCIDYFRFQAYEIPKEIVWICWVQDPMGAIMDKSTPNKLGSRDFILNHFTTWQEFQRVGYPIGLLIDAPTPANHEIYKSYELTAEEKAAYACDICFVCHASDVDKHIQKINASFPEELREMIAAVYKGYQSYVYETGELFYQQEIFKEYVRGALFQYYGIELVDKKLDYIARDMYLGFNQRVFRECLVDWIIDAGFTNIKLWGNGWKFNLKYKPYAMGPAENGATLSKIYQASRIVVGNNVMFTAATRAWETMLSGGFYLSNYIPEDTDAVDIRKILEVGKDVDMFYNKDDLIEKLHYYLDHEEERKIFIEKGHKVALEKMTYDSLVKRMLAEIGTRLYGEEK